MDGDGGIGLVRRLSRPPNRLCCVAWTRSPERTAALVCQAHAQAVVSRQEPLDELLLAVLAVLARYKHLSLAAGMSIAHGAFSIAAVSCLQAALLPSRQQQVFNLLGDGMTPSGIGTRLRISLKTVQTHIERLKYRLDCANQSELCRKAIRCCGK